MLKLIFESLTILFFQNHSIKAQAVGQSTVTQKLLKKKRATVANINDDHSYLVFSMHSWLGLGFVEKSETSCNHYLKTVMSKFIPTNYKQMNRGFCYLDSC